MKKFLGIDFGDKRIGLSLAEDRGPALPFKVILNNDQLIKQIKDIIHQENITDIVVGLPHSFSGRSNDRLKVTEEFVQSLRKVLEIRVSTVDEQLTSKLYEKMGVSKDIDKYAAAAILDTYLAKNV